MTLPTGKDDGLAKAIPSKEPAQAMWYCGAFSQKYFMELIGKARMEMKAGLTYACMNLKKLARMLENKGKRRLPASLKSLYLGSWIKNGQRNVSSQYYYRIA